MVSFTEAVTRCLFEKWSDAKGRAPRSEFWWYALFYISFWFAGAALFSAFDVAIVWSFGLAVIFFVPLVAVSIRRLHDAGMSGRWLWISLVPGAGQIILLVLMVLPSGPSNQYGEPYVTAQESERPVEAAPWDWRDAVPRASAEAGPTRFDPCPNCGRDINLATLYACPYCRTDLSGASVRS